MVTVIHIRQEVAVYRRILMLPAAEDTASADTRSFRR